MKQPRSGLTKNNKKIGHLFKIVMNAIAIITIFVSCENDIEKIKSFENNKEIPTLTSKDAEIIYTDSASLKVIINTPLIRQYGEHEEPFWEFPNGIHVRFFDEKEELESVITSEYAIYHVDNKLWEAKNKVEAKNLKKKEQLNTEQLFWDEKEQAIYSNKFTRIENEDGIFFGEGGFEANQDFTKWKLKSSRGTVNYKDE